MEKLAISHFSREEIHESRQLLYSALEPSLLEIEAIKKKKMNATRQLNKPELSVGDILDILENISEDQGLPVILATPSQVSMCPQTWGKPRDSMNIQKGEFKDLVERMEHMQTFIMGQIKGNSDSINDLKKEIQKTAGTIAKKGIQRKVSDIDSFSDIGSPLKRGRMNNIGENSKNTDVFSTPSAVLPTPSFDYVNVVKKGAMKSQESQEPKRQAKKPKSIVVGNARSEGSILSANVSLVASGVGLGITNSELDGFLKTRGLQPVQVERLTRDAVMNEVRSLTFKVTLKANDLESFLKAENWPNRVSVRYFRNYRPPRNENSGNNKNQLHHPPGINSLLPSQLATSNMFSGLSETVA